MKLKLHQIALSLLANSLLVLTLGLLSPSLGYAYIDPGSGSMLIQVIVAAIFGLLFTIKSWCGYFTGFFKVSSKTDSDEKNPNQENSDKRNRSE
jgi:hypothetical protein